MSRIARSAIAVSTVLLGSGCVGPGTKPDQHAQAPATDVDTTMSTESIPTDVGGSPPNAADSRQRATVVTHAGRIEATALDGELDVDVASATGWGAVIERRAHRARVEWTSGERSVVVELRVSLAGISQEVTSTN